MLPGFNHNIPYQGRLFHCQTEDSGIDKPHVITHVFYGGNIIASKKTSYAEQVQNPDLSTWLTELMKTQHKELIKSLLAGEMDSTIQERCVAKESVTVKTEDWEWKEDTSIEKVVIDYIAASKTDRT